MSGEPDSGLSFKFSGFWQQSLHMPFTFRLGEVSEMLADFQHTVS
jgi:hypothetical protein